MVDIRGNVDSRVRKAFDSAGTYDAIILAAAGLERLGQGSVVSEVLALDDMLPAPGQGALAVQCRDEIPSQMLLVPINDAESQIAVTAERAFLAGLGGGCSLPIAAYGTIEGGRLHLRGRVNALDGSKQVDVNLEGAADRGTAERLGGELARMALGQGVAALLENMR
jgi:hydroxymethylbilane synthase